ncbi:MAG: hypothetical protein EPN20_13425, partial [Magnetospirillum sp.]
KLSGAANDIDVSKLTITGEGGATYTLTTSSVDITSGTSFTITLSAADKAALNMILNKDGTTSTGTGTYNLAAAEDWAAGAAAAVNVADLTGNGITVSNVAAPTVTSATYDYGTGTLTVTGTGLLKRSGAANDIDVSRLTLSGKAGGTYTLTSTDVELTSGTTFTVTLNNADKAVINALLDTNGTVSGGSTYNLAAAGSWNRGSAVAAADPTGNGVTVSGVPKPVVAPPTQPPPPPPKEPVVGPKRGEGTGTGGGEGGGTGTDTGGKPGNGFGLPPIGSGPTVTGDPGGPQTSQTGDGGRVAIIPAVLTPPTNGAFQVAVMAKAAGAPDALVVNAPMKDAVVAEGARIAVTIPADAFAATKSDATVTLTATRMNGAALPGWMTFNPQTGTFEGTPPPGFKGEVVVKVIARDQDGHEAVQTFKIAVGEADQGRVAPGGAPGRTGDARPVGKPSLTEQLRSLSMKGQLARQAALFNAIKTGGKAA